MDYKFKTEPYAHQLHALGASHNKENFALFMEMGTGKSKVLVDNIAMLYDKGKIDGVLIDVEKNGYNVIPSAKAVNLTMNRDRIRDRAKLLGLKTANFAYAETEEELILEANKIGTKVAVKPVMSSSGKGQSLVNNKNDLVQAWDLAIEKSRGKSNKIILEATNKIKNK